MLTIAGGVILGMIGLVVLPIVAIFVCTVIGSVLYTIVYTFCLPIYTTLDVFCGGKRK